jgi:hypothetical protein
MEKSFSRSKRCNYHQSSLLENNRRIYIKRRKLRFSICCDDKGKAKKYEHIADSKIDYKQGVLLFALQQIARNGVLLSLAYHIFH